MGTTLIIGAGVSGLSAGIHLLLNGEKVIICEKHASAGGNLTGWKRGGYTIDNCIHWLTGTNPASKAYEMWRTLGVLGDCEIYHPEALYGCETELGTLMLGRNAEATEEQLICSAPEDEKLIRQLFRAIRALQYTDGVGGRDHSEGLTLHGGAQLMHLLPYLGLSVSELAVRFKSGALSRFISSFWGGDFGALALLYTAATFTAGNGDIPRGGSLSAAERMKNRFISLGGELMLKSEVESIEVCSGKAKHVTLKNGERITADSFISAIPAALTYEKLLHTEAPDILSNPFGKRSRRFSSIHAAFGLSNGHPTFRGTLVIKLSDENAAIVGNDTLILREFSHEESFAPIGNTVVEATAFLSEQKSRTFIDKAERSRSEYLEAKGAFANICLQEIAARTSRASTLTLLDYWTPATYKRYTGAPFGAYMGFILPPFHLPTTISPSVSAADNLFLATQWQRCPGGLPSAALAGKLAAGRVMRSRREVTPVFKWATVK